MGSKPGQVEGLQDIVRKFPEALSKIETQFKLSFKLISGGGNWRGETPDITTGLMGQWAYGATRGDIPAYFVTMLNLLKQEGLPFARGNAISLNQNGSQNRLGERTVGLVCVGDMFIVFPGGLGTLSELATIFTSADVNEHFGKKRIIIYDPMYHDGAANCNVRYWDDEIKSIRKMNKVGFISDDMARKINQHCLLYRPAEDLGSEDIISELISLIITIRYDNEDSFRALKISNADWSSVLEYCHRVNKNSIVQTLYDGSKFICREWEPILQKLRENN